MTSSQEHWQLKRQLKNIGMHRVVNLPLIKTLTSYLKRKPFFFLGGFAGLLVSRLFEGAVPYFLKIGIDRVSLAYSRVVNGQPYDETVLLLVFPAAALAACVLAKAVISASSQILIRWVGVEAATDLRYRLYDHLQKQGPAFFARYGIGDLMARTTNDINTIRQVFSSVLITTIVIVLTAAVSFFFMLNMSWQLTLVLMLPLPVMICLGYYISNAIYDRSFKFQRSFAKVLDFAQENLSGIHTVQTLGQEAREMERFAVVNQDLRKRNMALLRLEAMFLLFMPVVASVGTLIILGYGSYLLDQGEVTVGTLAAFFLYLSRVLSPLRNTGRVLSQWQQGVAAATRLFRILDHEPEIRDQPTDQYPSITGQIEIRALNYQYRNKNKYALRNIHLELKAGETLLIVGRIGSGKTTLLRLLVRLLEPNSGQILLDGHAIEHFPLKELRKQVCVVPQDPFLFSDSLGNNIRYDDPGRDDESVWESADAAALTSVIKELPEQLETLIGVDGANLSGGQKQRTALARGLIRSAPILILDDCFSSVDTETEERILSRLMRIRAGLTTILTSSRISTTRIADKIIELDEGEIAGFGTYQELLEAGGYVAELKRMQQSEYPTVADTEDAS